MDIDRFAYEWAWREDATIEGAEHHADDVAFLRSYLAENAEHLGRHWALLYRENHNTFVAYPFAGVCRRGWLLMSEGRVLICASIAGNGTPAAVWEAGREDEQLVRDIVEMHRKIDAGEYEDHDKIVMAR